MLRSDVKLESSIIFFPTYPSVYARKVEPLSFSFFLFSPHSGVTQPKAALFIKKMSGPLVFQARFFSLKVDLNYGADQRTISILEIRRQLSQNETIDSGNSTVKVQSFTFFSFFFLFSPYFSFLLSSFFFFFFLREPGELRRPARALCLSRE